MKMPVYVVNLDCDAERMQSMADQLDRLGLGFTRVPAVSGRDLPAAQREALYDANANRLRFPLPMVDGEIGCYASHLTVWQRLIANHQAAALVLEDDVLLDPSLLPVLEAIKALPMGWDMVKLMGRDRESLWQRWPLIEGVSLVRYRRVPNQTGAYLLSAAGARKLLAGRRPFYRPVDIDLRHWWECGLRLFGTCPYPVRDGQAAEQSSIGRRDRGVGAAYRWRKILYQAGYSLQAWRANWRTRHDTPLAK